MSQLRGSYVAFVAGVQFVEHVAEAHGHAAPGTISILLVQMERVYLEQEVLGQWLRISQALNNTGHEASVAEVTQTCQASIEFFLH